MRFSSKSVENIGIRTFSGAFLEKCVSHIKPSEVSFIRRDLGLGGSFSIVENKRPNGHRVARSEGPSPHIHI